MQRAALPDLSTFLLVAEQLSFRGAAARLELTAPAVSHSIRQLEARLGARLFNRTTRSVSLTQAGLRLLDRLRPAFDQISGALEELNEEQKRPVGRLRIWASPVAATIVVMPIWQRYLSTYPEVQLEIWADFSQPDIVASGFDAGIGPKRWAASDMIGVRVAAPMKVAVVGAPTYFAGRRPPRTPDDLASHNCIQYRLGARGPLFKWQFEQNGKTRQIAVAGRLSVNTPELAIRAVLDGLGIAYLPEELAAPFLRTGQLIRVLEGCSASVESQFLFYHGHRQVPTTLRAFIDMVRAPKSITDRRSVKNFF
ncbi:MAG TPA: LysR family transcriptional regulator [Xanthobacteraceae bacterium]|jgi:DNA-binding transcriptional LysR family regulator